MTLFARDQSEMSAAELKGLFAQQRAAYLRCPFPGLDQRRADLRTLESILTENVDAICDAVNQDFGNRSKEETMLLEIFVSVDTVRHARRNIGRWMKSRRRPVSVLFATGSNRLLPQPKGVAGIVVPWNYPVFLLISPLVSALAAGNRCMVKMAAHSPRLSALMHLLFERHFSRDKVAVCRGAAKRDFSSLPFDHLLFTGSSSAGRQVMRTAADTLTPVTLELGGKSPVIIADDFPIEKAASRIMYAKLVNAGQTCLAPDYVITPEPMRERFVAAAKNAVSKLYPDIASADYTSIISDAAYARLRATLDDARRRGARIEPLLANADFDGTLRKCPPCCVLEVSDAMRIMREEIFGPLLPVLSCRDIDAAVAYVNARPRPLGLYLFTNSRRVSDFVLKRTVAGGVTINNCIYHVAQGDLPFGGIGESGMGRYHGYEGFQEFSHMKPIFRQPRLSALHLFYPPYTKLHRMLFWLLLRLKR